MNLFDCAGSLLLCGLCSSCSGQAFRRCSFSYCWAQALQCSGCSSWNTRIPSLRLRALGQGSVVAVDGLSCPAARGIFLGQGLNPCLLHWQTDSLPMSHQGSPKMCFKVPHIWVFPVVLPSLPPTNVTCKLLQDSVHYLGQEASPPRTYPWTGQDPCRRTDHLPILTGHHLPMIVTLSWASLYT